MHDFFAAIYAGAPAGCVTVWSKGADGSSRTDWLQSMDTDAQAAAAAHADQAGRDVYFSPAISTSRGTELQRMKTGTPRAPRWLTSFFADIDTAEDPEKAGKHVPHNKDIACGVLHSLPCAPSIIVDSGHGIHAYWLLDKPADVTEEITDLLRRFAEGIKQATGWTDIDAHASEPARVLRVPGTHNRKAGGALPVTMLHHDPGTRYTVEELAQMAAPSGGTAAERGNNERTEAMKTPPPPAGDMLAVGLAKDEKLRRYWAGDFSGADFAGDESKCDFALMEKLAYWLSRDEAAMIAAFMQSDYAAGKDTKHTKKLQRRDYLPTTARRACASCTRTAAEDHEAFMMQRTTAATQSPEQAPTPPPPAQSWEPTDQNSGNPDYTDLGQARMLIRFSAGNLLYSQAVGWLEYDGKAWTPHFKDDAPAALTAHKLTDEQIREALARMIAADQAAATAAADGDKLAGDQAKHDHDRAAAYLKFAKQRRNSGPIMAALAQAKAIVSISVDDLDADPFALNTPAGVIDLQAGTIRPHHPDDRFTKITAASPGDEGADEWQQFLDVITCGDLELSEFLQQVAGMAAVGQVDAEQLIVAYGTGGNGKSTFFNALLGVLGDYGGTLNPEALNSDSRHNFGPELATLRGKRLVIASELDGEFRISTGTVKRVCSSDLIHAEPKYMTPFDFKPSHTLCLMTNILPIVTAKKDPAIWDRLICVPFQAENMRHDEGMIAGYSRQLVERCGPAIMTWIVAGAMRFMANGCRLILPQAVILATEEWRGVPSRIVDDFIAKRCKLNRKGAAAVGDVRAAYKAHCEEITEDKRGVSLPAWQDFADILETRFRKRKDRSKSYFYIGFTLNTGDEQPAE